MDGQPTLIGPARRRAPIVNWIWIAAPVVFAAIAWWLDCQPVGPSPGGGQTACLITSRQLHVDAQIPIQVRLRAVEVEIANRYSPQIAADPGIDCLAYNSVHAGERADVDNARRALLCQVNYFPDIEHHLAESAFARQVRPCAF